MTVRTRPKMKIKVVGGKVGGLEDVKKKDSEEKAKKGRGTDTDFEIFEEAVRPPLHEGRVKLQIDNALPFCFRSTCRLDF